MNTLKFSEKKESPASKAIQKIFNKFGGTNACALRLGLSGQLLSNWKTIGKVSMKKLAWTAKELDCDPIILNKEGLKELLEVLKKWGYTK